MIIEKNEFRNNRGDILRCNIFREKKLSPRGVIYCHGLFSDKNGRKISQIGPFLAENGYTVLTFDFSFSGESIRKISEISIIQEAEDIKSAVEFFRSYGISSIDIIGSSMGAAAALLYSPDADRLIQSLILIAPPIDFKELIRVLFGGKFPLAFQPDGKTLIDGKLISNSFLLELGNLDMIKIISGINLPVLIIHGERDNVVDLSNSIKLTKHLRKFPRLLTIKDGDHSLNRESEIDLIKKEILIWLENRNV